jgi:hypothetical protein
VSTGRQTVVVAPQRRRNRAFMALAVAPRASRPAALRELYTDAGSLIRHAAPTVTISKRSQ